MLRPLVPLLAFATLVLGARARADDLVPPTLKRFVEAALPVGMVPVDVDVKLWITILDTGLVGEVVIDRSGGDPWDQAAIEAARQFEFTPAFENGQALAVRVPFTYRFRSVTRRGTFPADRRERRLSQPTPGYRLSGTLLEKGTRTPLQGVTVVVLDPKNKDARFEATTDSEGAFRIDGLPARPVQLEIVTGEHEPIQREVQGEALREGADGTPMEPLYLDPVGLADYLTVVKDKPPPKAATQITLQEDELRKVPGSFGDPTRVVATLPGVARSPFGLGFYAVRGASFENTGFFVDGHPVLFLYHLLGGPGVLAPDLVGSLDFYPGGYPVRFGRFSTGAILIDTKDPPSDRWHADVNIDLLKASGLFSIPFDDDKGIVTASFRRSYYELFLPLVQPDVSLSYLDYQFRVAYAPIPTVRTRFVAMGAEDVLGQTGEVGDSGEAQSSELILGFHRVLAEVEWDIVKGLLWKSSLAWEYDRNSIERTSDDDDGITADVAGWFLSWRNDFDWKVLPNLTLSGGLDTFYSTLGAKLRIPSFPPLGDPRPPSFDPIIISSEVTAPYVSTDPWVSADWEIVKGLRLLPGFRLSLNEYGDTWKWGPDPRLSVRYEVAPGWTLIAMGAMSHEVPSPIQFAEPYGDPDVPLLTGVQGSFGVEYTPGEGWLVKLEAYYNHLYNMIRPNGGSSVDGDNVEQRFWTADMEGRGYGLEVFIRKEYGGRHYGWISYTLARAERLRPPGEWTLYENEQTHNLNVAWSVILGRDWSVGARFTLTTGNFYYPVTGSRYDADRDQYEPIYANESERFGVFHRLDLRVDKRWRFDTWMLEAYLDIQNVYNASNPEAQRYSYDYRIRTEGVSVPILPTIGLRAVF